MKKYILISIALLFVLAAGQFDAAQTAKKDLNHDTPMYQGYVASHDTVMMKWYDGGNHEYNPSFPSIPALGLWEADYWHSMKHGWIVMYACAIATLSCSLFDGWKKRCLVWITVCWFAWGFEGESFRIGYGNLYRNAPKDSIIKILGDINPFINSH
jgi:hypothetical protein